MVFCNHNPEAGENGCRWRRRKEARPEEILDAALQLFTEKGFSATRICDVTKRAGISKGTLYLYFDSKETILKEVVHQLIEPQLDQVELLVEQYEGSYSDLLTRMVTDWWQKIHQTQLSAIPKIIISESGNFPELADYFVKHIVKRPRRFFTKVIEKGIASGEFRQGNADSLARLIIAPIVYTAIWKHSLSTFDDVMNTDDFIQQHIKMFLAGLAPEQGSLT